MLVNDVRKFYAMATARVAGIFKTSSKPIHAAISLQLSCAFVKLHPVAPSQPQFLFANSTVDFNVSAAAQNRYDPFSKWGPFGPLALVRLGRATN